MAGSDRKGCVYLDMESARAPLEASAATGAVLGERILALARGHGRVLGAFAYGDIDGDEAKELKRAGFEPRLTSEDGEGSAPESIAIAIDATEAACRGPAVEFTLLVSDDAQLGDLIRRLRRLGRYVLALVPEALLDQEPARSADRAVSVEALLKGGVEADLPAEEPRAREPSRPRPPSGQTIDFATYDWTRLVILMRDLELKMPFVGMRWLKNKVIGPHNVSAVTIADKQLLLNRAVEEGLIETYRVSNRDETGDPVTACRLLRASERVQAILAAHALPAPSAPETAPAVPEPAAAEG